MPVAIVLRSYDVSNLKAILRGLESRTAPAEIRDALLPVGDLAGGLLAELAQAADPRAAIDLLASMALPFAVPLLRLRGERPGASIAEMELCLDQWYFRQAFTFLREAQDETLERALWLEADLINLQTVLRLAATPQAQETLPEQLGLDHLPSLFVGPGRIPPSLLERAARQNTVPEAVERLNATIYAAPLAAGLDDYRRSGRLSAFERQLYRFRLRWLAGLFARHPLGSGVLLGYVALKTNEVRNLRWITNGIFLSLPADQIRAELVNVT
jgi:vacuolar-type H+-ATPase subunit C/Vma6